MRQALLDVHVDYGRTADEKEIAFYAVDGTPGIFFVSSECFRRNNQGIVKLVVHVLDSVDDLVFVEIPGKPIYGPKRRVVSLDVIEHINRE